MLARLAATLVAVSSLPARAQPGGEAAAAVDPETARARQHFQNGIKLYADGNFQGALAEFDAAYRLKPGPSSLKNIALCQKGLFRYTDAVETLQKVLERHGAEISADEKRAISSAMTELSALVGSVIVRVTPQSARVTLDGRALGPSELGTSIRLNTGEHVIVAESPGYARQARTIRVAGGQKDVPIDFALEAVAGFVTIRSKDPKAAIAIDGKALAFSHWNGPLSAGAHYVQVYRDGMKPFEQRFVVELGKSVEIEAELSADSAPAPKKGTQLRGWYALGVLSGLGLRNAPEGLQLDNSKISGGSFGVRAGYRVWTPIAVEMLLEGGRHDVEAACDTNVEKKAGRDCASDPFERSFRLDSVRLGPALRVMSGGESLRFSSTVGAGAVRHEIRLDEPDKTDPAYDPSIYGGNAKGWDPYFLLEVGLQYNWGHVLLELDGLVFLDGASNVRGKLDDGSRWEPFKDTGGLIMGGIGLRAGWSEWAPSN